MNLITKGKNVKSIKEITLIYLKALKNCKDYNKTPLFLDEIIERKKIFYDASLLEKILMQLEERGLIRRIDGVTYLKDDSNNYADKLSYFQNL